MPFRKGHTKIGGRKKGSQNKLNKDLRERIQLLIDENWTTLSEDMVALDPKVRIELIIKFMDFTLPRLSRVNMDLSPRIDSLLNMSETERSYRIQELRNKMEEND